MPNNEAFDRRKISEIRQRHGRRAQRSHLVAGRESSTVQKRRPRYRRQRPHQHRPDRLRRPRPLRCQCFRHFAQKHNDACQIVAVCDVYEKRKKLAAEQVQGQGYLDYRELLDQSDIDAVIVATPDHWHGKIAHGRHGQGQGRVPGKAHGPHQRGSAAAGGHGEGDQAHPAGGLADHFRRHVVEGQEGDRRRHDRADDR